MDTLYLIYKVDYGEDQKRTYFLGIFDDKIKAEECKKINKADMEEVSLNCTDSIELW